MSPHIFSSKQVSSLAKQSMTDQHMTVYKMTTNFQPYYYVHKTERKEWNQIYTIIELEVHLLENVL